MEPSFDTAKKAGMIYWAMAAVFAAFAITCLLIVNVATIEANRHAAAAEVNLANAEMQNLADSAKREQAEISFWDKALDRLILSEELDEEFAFENFSDWLIHDFGYSQIVLLDKDNKAKMVALPGEVNITTPASELVPFASDLIQLARDKYRNKRQEVDGKYIVEPEAGSVVPDIQAFAFRIWQGVPSIIVAQVMATPTEEFATTEKQEFVLLSIKPLTENMIAKSASRLNLANVKITPALQKLENSSIVPMFDMAANSSLNLSWQPDDPRHFIIEKVLPIGVIMTMLLAVFLNMILRSNSNLFKRLIESQKTNIYLASHDSLTGLANRQQFETALGQAFNVIENSGFALMFIDLDKFKQANDTYGHQAGDAVLKVVAERLQNRVGDLGMAARLGGDEFVVLITKNTSEHEVRKLAVDLIESCSMPIQFEKHRISVGASIGIALAPRDGANPEAILQAADTALYESKRNGRGRAMIWKMAA